MSATSIVNLPPRRRTWLRRTSFSWWILIRTSSPDSHSSIRNSCNTSEHAVVAPPDNVTIQKPMQKNERLKDKKLFSNLNFKAKNLEEEVDKIFPRFLNEKPFKFRYDWDFYACTCYIVARSPSSFLLRSSVNDVTITSLRIVTYDSGTTVRLNFLFCAYVYRNFIVEL